MDLILLNLKELSLHVDDPFMWNMLINSLEEEDELKQLTHLKQIAQNLKRNECFNIPNKKDQEQFIAVLADMYQAAETKSAHSRTIASILQAFPESLQEVTVRVMRERVERDIANFKLTDNTASMRRKIDFVSAHMENFPLGETVIRGCVLQVLPFLHQCLGQIVDLTRNSSNVIEKTEFMHHCLKCLKTVMSLVQKCSERICEYMEDKLLTEVLEGITYHSSQVLNDEIFSMDCRSAAGMAVALMAKTRSGEDASLKQLIDLLCNHVGQKCHTMTTVSSSLVPLSRLFLLHGILAMYSRPALLQKATVDRAENVFLTNVAFWELMSLSTELTEASWSLCAARTIVQWTVVARNSAKCYEWLRSSLHGTGGIAKQLMVYIWKNWDHPIDGIRHQCRSIFENLIQTHIVCQQGATCLDVSLEMDHISEDAFLVDIFHILMTSSWHVRSKYRLLVVMVPYFRVEKILVLYPTITRDLMMAMTEQSIAPYASELLEKLFKQHFCESKDILEEWCHAWIMPALTILLGDSLEKQQDKYLSQYFIPKVLKCNPSCLSFVMYSMDSHVAMVTHGSRRLSILIMWLKVARSVGVLKNNNHTEHEPTQNLWKGIVTMGTLQQALCHRDNQVTLDALGLLCDSRKTTEEFCRDELQLLQQCLPLYMINQSASFRQQVVALIKKMLCRLRETSKSFEKSLKKSQKKGDSQEEIMLTGKLNVYKEFLVKLWQLLMDGLNPGNSYPHRTTALLIITTIRTVFKDESCAIVDYNALWKLGNSTLLLQRLTDTFDTNKVMAFDLLRDLKQDCLGWEDPDKLSKMYKCGFRLATSSKPHHCETAAYLLRLLAQQDSPPLKQHQGKNEVVKAVLEDLSRDLEMQIEKGHSSLLEAAANGPMYGILHCMRALLADIVPRELVHQSGWVDLFQRILSLSLAVAGVASPTVCNSSPEGYIPEMDENAEHTVRTQKKAGSVTSSHLEVFHVTPQMVLVCCWRSMKEVSLTLGQLTLTLPIEGEGLQLYVLSLKQVEDIGKLFLKLLMESKHRGAFELAYAGFEKLCVRLWRSSNPGLASFPEKWLHDLLSEVTKGTGSLCSTRRSAGVPFAIQAIVGTEPDVLGKRNFKETMLTLIELVSDTSSSEEAEKVHALNILRTLYRDTRLGEEVFQFVSDGVRAAVTGFGSQQWAVRNSSTLLFSALVTRIFGVNREKDELSKKNCMTGREFFSRFPSLHSFLMGRLQSSLESSEGSLLHPSLFPTLIILSHLHPSYQGVDTASLGTDAMIPLVISCSQCAVYKTRCMAARALSSLVSLNDVISTLVSLIQSLPLTMVDCVNQNQLHGCLLMVMSLIEGHIKKAGTISTITKQFFSDVLPLLESHSWISSYQNKCATTRAAFMQTINMIAMDKQWLLSLSLTQEVAKTLSVFRSNFIEIFCHDHSKPSCLLQPDYVALAKQEALFLARLMMTPKEHVQNTTRSLNEIGSTPDRRLSDDLKISHSCFSLKLLCSPLYEVRLIGLDLILNEGTSLQPLTSGDGKDDETITGFHEFSDNSTIEPTLTKLVAMVTGSEHNVECLGKVLQVLTDKFSVQAVTRILSTKYQMPTLTFFKNMLDLANCHSIRDDVCSPIISMTGKLMLEPGMVESGCFGEMLAEWTGFVESLYSDESSTELSVSVCTALCNAILAACRCTDKVEVKLNIRLWNLLVHLLLRNEQVTQELAVGGLQRVRRCAGLGSQVKDEYNPMMHCRLVIELSVHLFINLFLELDPESCLGQLCSWACGDVRSIKEQYIDENKMEQTKLFERGETSSNSDTNLVIGAALLGLSSIEAACTCLDIPCEQSSAPSTGKTESCRSLHFSNVSLRIETPIDIIYLNQTACNLFQEICQKVEFSIQNQPSFTPETTFLNVDQFEANCLQINRYLNCISHLVSISKVPNLQCNANASILQNLQHRIEEKIGRFVTKV